MQACLPVYWSAWATCGSRSEPGKPHRAASASFPFTSQQQCPGTGVTPICKAAPAPSLSAPPPRPSLCEMLSFDSSLLGSNLSLDQRGRAGDSLGCCYFFGMWHPNRDRTLAPGIGSMESQPPDCRGSPCFVSLMAPWNSKLWRCHYVSVCLLKDTFVFIILIVSNRVMSVTVRGTALVRVPA